MPIWKTLLTVILLVPVTLTLANCGGGSRHASSESYYLVATNTKVPYWETAHDGWRQAASQLKIKVEFVGPETYDPKAQQEEFRRIVNLSNKPSGMVVSPADPELMKPEIDAAIQKGIPVITIDSDSPNSKRLAFVGTNNYQAGVLGAQIAVKALNGKGNVVVFTMPNQTNLNERLRGYRDIFAEHPQIKISQVIDIKGDPRIAFDTTKEMIVKKTPVDAFICLEALAGKEVADVLDRNNTSKVIVAMDTDEGTLDWIRKGKIAGTVAQKPYTMAYYGLQMIDDIHHNPPKGMATMNWAQVPFAPVPAFVDTGATLITKDNLDAFISARDAAKQGK
jgi:ribose transport system substrate-binding protein